MGVVGLRILAKLPGDRWAERADMSQVGVAGVDQRLMCGLQRPSRRRPRPVPSSVEAGSSRLGWGPLASPAPWQGLRKAFRTHVSIRGCRIPSQLIREQRLP